MNYNKLAQKAHQAAVKGGWYEQKRTVNELLCLICSEAFEAMEAWRKQHHAELNQVQKDNFYHLLAINIEEFKKVFKRDVKDTMDDELADVCVRIFDMAGYYNVEIPEVKLFEPCTTFMQDVWNFTGIALSMSDEQMTGTKVAILLGYILGICKKYDIDLETHIDLKMSYNATRGVRHGNKIA